MVHKMRLLMLEACLCLILARLMLLFWHFKRIAAWMGEPLSAQYLAQEGSAEKASPSSKRVGAVINRASRRLPFHCTCFVKALAANMMLRRRKMNGTIYLGLKKDVKKNLLAHAWISCGDAILTGGECSSEFTVVAAFR